MSSLLDTRPLANWKLEGCRCVMCSEPMRGINNRTYWCKLCGTIGYEYKIGSAPPYVRFDAPQVVLSENTAHTP